MHRAHPIHRVAVFLPCALALAGGAGEALGAVTYWNVTSGNWSTGTSWTAGEPTGTDQAYIGAFPGVSSGTATINQSGEVCQSLYVGSAVSDSGTVIMTAGSLQVGMYEHVGAYGRGHFDHSGGSHSAENLYLGVNSSAAGTYALSGDATLSCDLAVIGAGGSGLMTQDGSSQYTGTSLFLGSNPGGSAGTYILNAGTLSVTCQLLGVSGNGRLEQSGGTNTAADVTLGENAYSCGEYVLTGSGSLSADDVDVGKSGSGTFTHDAGSHTVANQLSLGASGAGAGTYRLSGTGSLSAYREFVGQWGTGGFEQSGGTNTIGSGGRLSLGVQSGAQGTYTLTGGSLSGPVVEVGCLGAGTFVHSGGTHTPRDLFVGSSAGSQGSYDLSGTGTVNATAVLVADAGTGVFNQTGGRNNVSSDLYVGFFSSGNGSYELAAGTLASTHVSIGLEGTGSFLQTGGTHTAYTNVRLGLNTGSGTYDLRGGLLDVHILDVGTTSTGNTFLHSGGTNDVDSLYVASGAGAGGHYSLSGTGVVTAGVEYIGQQGAAYFAQSSGTNAVSGCVWLGQMTSGDGTYSLTGGSLSAWELYVGNSGKGTFNQTGGSAAFGASIYVGTLAGSSGTANIRGQFSGQTLYIGHYGTGYVQHSGGTVSINLLNIANEAGSSGRYWLCGSGVLTTPNAYVGYKGAGELTIDGTMTIASDLLIAAMPGSSGVLNVSSGSCSAGDVTNNGSIDQVGGSLSATSLDNNAGASLTVGGTGWLQVDTVRNYAAAVQQGNSSIRGKIAQQGVFYNYGVLTQDGGAFHDRLVNTGTYTYNDGSFGGLLENWGGFSFAKAFTAGAGLTSYVPLSTANGKGITANGAGLTNYATLTIVPGGDLAGTGVTNEYGAQLTGAGTIATNLTNNGTLTPAGMFIVTGQLTNAGEIAIQPLKGVRADAGLTNQAGGRISGCGGLFADVTNNGGLIHADGDSALSLAGMSGGNVGGGELRVADGSTLQIGGAFASSGWIKLSGAGAILASGTIANTGAIIGAGRVTGGVLNSGVLRADGGPLTLGGAGCGNTSAGQIEVPGGTGVTFTQGLAASSGGIYLGGGTFDANGHDMTSSGQITGHGTFRAGTLTNTGVVGVGVGDLEVLANVVNSGTVGVQAGSRAVFFGDVSGPGSFAGTGTVMFLANYSPGASPGKVAFGGDVVFGAAASLAAEIGGNAAGAEYDQINIAGRASPDGALDVVLIDGFLPEPNDVFQIITCGSRGGEFASATGLDDLGGYAGLDFELVYEADGVELLASAHKGDANLDARVDVLDLARLANKFGKAPAKWRDANFNGDDKVDVLDLAIFANHFGWSGGGGGAEAPVPEPATLALLALASLALARGRRA